MIYIYGYNMLNLEKFMLEFRGDLPTFIDVPGEKARTRVLEYKKTLVFCRKCQEFGHSQKWCSNLARCGKCSETGHETRDCEVRSLKCYHCGEQHFTGNREC